MDYWNGFNKGKWNENIDVKSQEENGAEFIFSLKLLQE